MMYSGARRLWGQAAPCRCTEASSEASENAGKYSWTGVVPAEVYSRTEALWVEGIHNAAATLLNGEHRIQ